MPIDLRGGKPAQLDQNLQDMLAKLKEPQVRSSAAAAPLGKDEVLTVHSDGLVTSDKEVVKEEVPVVYPDPIGKPVFTFLVGELVHLEGRITNIMGDEIHVQLAENNRTYIFPRKLFVEAHS